MNKLTPQHIATVHQFVAAFKRGEPAAAEALVRTLPKWVLLEMREVIQEMMSEAATSKS